MPDTDILSQLLPALMQQGQAPDNSGEMGALAAFQNSPFLQGEPSHSGPMGQISQAIMPLIAAKIYEKQGQQDHQAKTLEHLTEIIKLSNAIDDRKLKQLKLQAEQDPTGQSKKLVTLIESVRHTPGMENAKVSGKLGGLNVSVGGENKMPTNLIGLMDRARTDPQAAGLLQQYEGRQDARADEANLRTTQRAQLLQEQAGERREARDQAKPAPSGKVYYDPTTNERVARPSVGDLTNKGLKDLTPAEGFAVEQVKSALRQYAELDTLIDKLLPKYDKTANTLSQVYSTQVKGRSNLAELRAKSDPDVRRFDQLSTLSKFPAITALNRSGRLPIAEINAMSRIDVGGGDSADSAHAAVDEYRKLITEKIGAMGLNPDALGEASPTKASTAGGGAMTPKAAEIGTQIKQMQSMGKSSDEIKSILRSLYGGNIDVE